MIITKNLILINEIDFKNHETMRITFMALLQRRF